MAAGVAQITGMKSILKMLENAPEHAYAVSRTSMSKAATVIRKQLKSNAKEIEDTGTYHRSVGSIIKSNSRYKKRGVVFAAVGPRKNYSELHTREDTGASIKVRPEKYAHLVEWGTRHSRGLYIQQRAFQEKKDEAINEFTKNVPKALIKRMAKDGNKKSR